MPKKIDEDILTFITSDRVEGGYSTSKSDRGNYIGKGKNRKFIGTNHGISAPVLKEHLGRDITVEDMKNLSKDQAKNIYRDKYIRKPGFDKIEDPTMRALAIDYGINSGTSQSKRDYIKAMRNNPDKENAMQDFIGRRTGLIHGSRRIAENQKPGLLNRVSNVADFATELKEETPVANKLKQQISGNIDSNNIDGKSLVEVGSMDNKDVIEEERNKKKKKVVKGDESVFYGSPEEPLRDPFSRPEATYQEAPKDVVTPAPPKEESKGVSSQFSDALGFFLPQIIGGLAGAAFEGTEGALGGIQASGQARDAFLKHQDNKEKLAIEKSKEGRLKKGRDRFQLSTMQNDKGESEVFRVNLDTGSKESLGTKGYAKGFVKDPSSGFLVNKQTGKMLNLSGDSTNKTFFSALTPVQRSQFQDLRKGFLSDSKPMRDAAAKVEGLISRQVDEAMVNSVAANQLGAQVASIYENGRLTDEDVVRYTKRTGIPDRVADIIKDLKHGTISADKAGDIKDALKVLREVVIDQVNSKAQERSDVFASDWGIAAEDVNQAFWKKMSIPKGAKKAPEVTGNEPTYQERIRAAESVEEINQIKKEFKRGN